MLDLDVDLGHFHRLARRDPILAPIVRRRSGIRLPQLLDPFEGLTRAILGQQVSVAGASTITDRLVRLVSRPVPGAKNSGFLAFPTPADVAEAGADRLREIGLTRARAATLHGAAQRIADGALDLERLRTFGFQGLLLKPYTAQALAQSLHEALAARKEPVLNRK